MKIKRIPEAERCAILTGNEGWFGAAPPEFQAAVLSRCAWSEVQAGEVIYRASDTEAQLAGIVDGAVEIYSRYGAGDNPMLNLLHEGVWIGFGSAVLPGQRPRVTAVARTTVLLARLPSRVIHELLAQRPDWWPIMARALLEYGDFAISAYADSLIDDSARRCACTLLRLGGLRIPRRSRPEWASVPTTQYELATLVNVSRTTLLQILRRFEHLGLLEQGYRSLRILNPTGLETIAAGHGDQQ